MDENTFMSKPPVNPLKIELNIALGFRLDYNFVELKTSIYYKYPDEIDEITILAQGQFQNVFEVSNLNNYYFDKSYIKLPSLAITNLVGLSISHSRALMTQKLAGTVFQDQILTALDAEHVARHFFPYMFS